ATQSFVDPSYGKLGLELMRTGKSAPERNWLRTRNGRAQFAEAGADYTGVDLTDAAVELARKRFEL
ncbi:MAG TPA: hypothetical protein DCK99_19065, partial [Blastocatellia bacterium]|nr:hypothetical protein [Blastocatellia bacterium]